MLENNFELCQPFVRETQYHKSLHFYLSAVQSQMLKRDPNAHLADYTCTMTGFLMFDSAPGRIAMVGLGGGSLAKFCYRELPRSRIDVVEINPHVVALREEFHVPPTTKGSEFIWTMEHALSLSPSDSSTYCWWTPITAKACLHS